MKKRLAVLGGNGTAHPISKICATLLIGIGLSLSAFSVHADGNRSGGNTNGENNNGGNPSPTPKQPPPSPTPKPPKPSPTPKGTCAVCDHQGGKNIDRQINCK